MADYGQPMRLHLDPLAQVVEVDGKAHVITCPVAFALFQVLSESCPTPLTAAQLSPLVPSCRGGRRRVRVLIGRLPLPLQRAVCSAECGYWLRLDPLPKRSPDRATTALRPSKGGLV